jgi:hypothetical protein
MRRRRLSQADLRALGVQGGLVATRYSPESKRAEVRQLAAEGSERRREFVCRLTHDTKASE